LDTPSYTPFRICIIFFVHLLQTKPSVFYLIYFELYSIGANEL